MLKKPVNSFHIYRILVILLVMMSVTLGACARPRPFNPNKPEPGLFSGKSGELVIYNSKTRKR